MVCPTPPLENTFRRHWLVANIVEAILQKNILHTPFLEVSLTFFSVEIILWIETRDVEIVSEPDPDSTRNEAVRAVDGSCSKSAINFKKVPQILKQYMRMGHGYDAF